MNIQKTESDNGNSVTLVIPERFDFSNHNEFRETYRESVAKKFIIDMKNTSYLDSAALGMLLQLRNHAGGDKSSITIKNAKDNVKEILQIANFHQLMVMN